MWLLAVALMAPACAARADYVRLFRGVKRAELGQGEFLERLAAFIPKLPRTHARNGLKAYLPAVPPDGKPGVIPDEVALVAYESEAAYRAAQATPEGAAYADAHWVLFDKERSGRGAVSPLGDEIVAGVPYDVLGKTVDWRFGYSTFFIGLRQDGVPAESFLKKLHEHVLEARDAFGSRGLDGYVVVATRDYEIAYLHWPSKAAAEAAWRTEKGQAAVAGARALLKPLQFSDTEPYDGAPRPGRAFNVWF